MRRPLGEHREREKETHRATPLCLPYLRDAAWQEPSSSLPSHLLFSPAFASLPPLCTYLWKPINDIYHTSSTYLSIIKPFFIASSFFSLTRRRGSEHHNPTRLVTPLFLFLHFFQHYDKSSLSSCLESAAVYHILTILDTPRFLDSTLRWTPHHAPGPLI